MITLGFDATTVVTTHGPTVWSTLIVVGRADEGAGPNPVTVEGGCAREPRGQTRSGH